MRPCACPAIQASQGALVDDPTSALEGTLSQVEWAECIRRDVAAEFDRVAAAFRSVADKQAQETRDDTETVIAILEEKRAEVLGVQRAGYFIKFWQEITDQVRQMISHDPRYQEIKARREARRQRCER